MYTTYSSPIGRLILHYDAALRGLWMEGQAHFPSHATGPTSGEARPVTAWLDGYFSGKNPHVTFPLEPEGTAFQRAVWSALREIEYGTLTTYGELANIVSARLGHSTSARAVGGAVGRNPISIIIPCHRVVGSDGSMTGYAGGIERKEWLLSHESGQLPTV